MILTPAHNCSMSLVNSPLSSTVISVSGVAQTNTCCICFPSTVRLFAETESTILERRMGLSYSIRVGGSSSCPQTPSRRRLQGRCF